MSQSAIHLYPEGPSLPGSLITSPPLNYHLDHHSSSPSTYSSPSPLSLASTPTAAMAVSPVTVYSDRLLYQASSALVPAQGREQASRQNAPNAPIEFVRAHAKGVVRFRPFENDLDEAAMAAIAEFQVYPFGDIEEYCRHIPYASSKKDFYNKTGRESFEVFQYVFKVPGDNKEYHVMWDYNVGLVRMTPFFKCCKYSKTTPAKMLGLNPGLREITHSITGGSIMAQGYWMPYSCAKAVCATFCCHIAGALIPIFGPDFPSQCLPPQSPEYGRMVIEKALVQEATRDTELMRQIALRDSASAAGTKTLPFHRRQSPDPFDHYDHYDRYDHYDHDHHGYRGGPAQRPQTQMRTHRAVDARFQEIHDPGSNHLPPPAMRSSCHAHAHAHARSESRNVAAYECGPELAPLKHYSPHHGTLMPSPIEHERLPPFSHIASLTSSTHQPEREERGSTTLPPLIIRHDYRHDYRHYYQHHSGHYSTLESRVEALYPETPRGEGKRCLTMDVNRYEDHPRHHGTDYRNPERPYSWVGHDGSRRPVDARASAAAAGYISDTMEEDQDHAGRFASSSCYPSPPRLLPLVPYEHGHGHEHDHDEPGSRWKRSPVYASRFADGQEVDRARDTKSHRKSVSTSSLPPQRHRHHHHQHKTSTTTGRRKSKIGNSSMPRNAKDVNAAELLVKLGDRGPGQSGYEERIRDSSIDIKTSCSPKLQLRTLTPTQTLRPSQSQSETRKSTGQRFAASIPSLLCDDATPRKKRRGV